MTAERPNSSASLRVDVTGNTALTFSSGGAGAEASSSWPLATRLAPSDAQRTRSPPPPPPPRGPSGVASTPSRRAAPTPGLDLRGGVGFGPPSSLPVRH